MAGVWLDQAMRVQEAVVAGEEAGLDAIGLLRARGLHLFGYLAGVDGVAERGRANFQLPTEAVPTGAPPSIVGLATLVDLALGAAAWTGAGASDRVATTHLSLQIWDWPGDEVVTARAVIAGGTELQISSRAVLRAGGRRIGQALGGFRRLKGQSQTMTSNPWARETPRIRTERLSVGDLTENETDALDVVRRAAVTATLEAPLLVQLLGLEWKREAGSDIARAVLVPGWQVANVAGHVQGGAIAGALALAGQAAVGCAHRQPVEMSVQYLRPAAGTQLPVWAWVARRGYSTASGTAQMENEAGETVAIGQFSFQLEGNALA